MANFNYGVTDLILILIRRIRFEARRETDNGPREGVDKTNCSRCRDSLRAHV